jgi:hypothetical protein
MRYVLWLATAAVLTAALVGCSSGTTAAPAPATRPDISGTWLNAPGQPLRPPDGEPIPLTPWAAERMKAERPAQGENQDFADTTDPSMKYADPNGYPRVSMHPMRFKLVQTDDYVYQLWEYNQNWRQIALNQPLPSDPPVTWYGHAVGKWDGDTLVVDSIGYKDSTWLDSRGVPHTQDLHIVERIHRDGENLVFDFTFEDPGAFTKPWSGRLVFKPAPDGSMTESIFTISDELRFRERFLDQKPTIPIRR